MASTEVKWDLAKENIGAARLICTLSKERKKTGGRDGWGGSVTGTDTRNFSLALYNQECGPHKTVFFLFFLFLSISRARTQHRCQVLEDVMSHTTTDWRSNKRAGGRAVIALCWLLGWLVLAGSFCGKKKVELAAFPHANRRVHTGADHVGR